VSQLRVAVIGAGNLGRIHTRLLAENANVQLVAVADPNPAALKPIEEQFNVVTVSDFQSLIGQIDAAVVATPTRFHHQVASELLENGIHTLIEKPIADCISDAQDLVNIARRTKSVVQIGHVEQFNPTFKEALAKIGQPKFVQASRMSGYTFRSTDIGVVYDLMIHDIDLVNSMMPGSLMETRAIGMSIFGQNEDMAQARLQFDCGAVANLTASRCSFAPERSMQIFGTEGFAQIDFTQSKVTLIEIPSWMRNRELDFFHLSLQQQAFVRESLFDNVLKKREIEVPRSNAIHDEHQDWILAIKEGRDPKVSIEQGAAALAIAKSVLDSLNTHRWERNNMATTGPLAKLPWSEAGDAIPAELSPDQITTIRRAA